MYTNGFAKIIQYLALNIFLSIFKVCKIFENPRCRVLWSGDLKPKLIVTIERKTTTSARLVGLPARNFGFSGEFRVYTNDPEEMSRNLSVQIENLSWKLRQISRKTVITRLEAGNEPRRFSLWGDRKITIGTASAADDIVLRRWRVTSRRIRTVLERLFCIWRCEFFYRTPKFAKMVKIRDSGGVPSLTDFCIFGNRKVTILAHF